MQFSGKGKRLRKTEDEYSQGRPCQGFHVYITKQLDLLLPFFFVKDGNFLVIYGAQRPRLYFHIEMKPRYYVADIM